MTDLVNGLLAVARAHSRSARIGSLQALALGLAWVSVFLLGVPAHGAEVLKGKLIANQVGTVSAEITGHRTVLVDKLLVTEGERVKRGALLAQLNTDQIKSDRMVAVEALSEAEAAIGVAEAALKGARNQLSRQTGLERSAAFRRSLLEDAQVAVESASAQLKQAQAAVLRRKAEISRLDVEIRNADIRAPYDAAVVSILANVGAAATQSKPDLMTLRDLSRVDIETRLEPEMVARLQNSRKVHCDLGDGQKRAAEIVGVMPAEGGERRFLLRLRLESADQPPPMTSGQTATVYVDG